MADATECSRARDMQMNQTTAGAAAGAVGLGRDGPASSSSAPARSSVFYGAKQALIDVDLDICQNQVTALIGPSGCGKSTFLRCLNRMNDTIDGCRVTGEHPARRRGHLRHGDGRRCSCAPASAWCSRSPIRFRSRSTRTSPTARASTASPRTRPSSTRSSRPACERAGLWDEVKDRLQQPGTGLSGGQQQRLCIARAIAVQPGGDPDGRALLGARPDRHRPDRGTDRRAAPELHHRHRHPLHAAGGARLAAHRLLPPRHPGRGRRDRARSSPIPTTSARRTTSPAGSAEVRAQASRSADRR